jgi:hypothetical protein
MTKTIKAIITAPTKNVKKPTNVIKLENTDAKPRVSLFSAIDNIPKPILSPRERRKSVEATHNVRLITTKPVCSFLRSKSFMEKKVSLI